MVARTVLNMVRPQPFILLAVDKPLGLPGWPMAFIHLVFPHHPLDQAQLVIAVEHLKVFRQAGVFPMRQQQAMGNPVFFFSSRRRHTRWTGDWSSDVCSSD